MDGMCSALGVLKNGCPETQFFIIEPFRPYDARTHQPPHKMMVMAWMRSGFGEVWTELRFKNGWYESQYGDLYSALEDPEASITAPDAVSHWLVLGDPTRIGGYQG